MKADTVDILLSTYNGETHLPVQLESIVQQDYADWRLIIRDDGSKDNTVQIIEQFRMKYPYKVVIIKDSLGNLGYNKSFMELLKHSVADYMMFCDQDDYWYPNKISALLNALKNEGQKCVPGAELAFSDVQIADNKLNVIRESFFKYIGYNPVKGNQVFFLRNYVPGCNMMFKKSLIQKVLKTENIIGHHDHWIIMVAASVSNVLCLDKPLMKYRTHGKNAIGVDIERENKTGVLMKDILKYSFQNKKYRDALYSKNIAQLQNICSVFADSVSKDANFFSNIDKSNFFARKISNLSKPYISGHSFMEQLTYLLCF